MKQVLSWTLAYKELLGGGTLPATPGIGKGKKKPEEMEESHGDEVTTAKQRVLKPEYFQKCLKSGPNVQAP